MVAVWKRDGFRATEVPLEDSGTLKDVAYYV